MIFFRSGKKNHAMRKNRRFFNAKLKKCRENSPNKGELNNHFILKPRYANLNGMARFLTCPIQTKTHSNMNNLLYLIAVILIIGWIFGFFVYSAGGLIHILLVIALIAIVLRLIRGDRV